jgi:enoyl-CoA hydratase/carnithine racemase
VASGLAVERRGDALWLRLDRPEKLNAIDLALRDALWEALTLARDDSTLRVVVIEGAGDRAFSTGADISEFGSWRCRRWRWATSRRPAARSYCRASCPPGRPRACC